MLQHWRAAQENTLQPTEPKLPAFVVSEGDQGLRLPTPISLATHSFLEAFTVEGLPTSHSLSPRGSAPPLTKVKMVPGGLSLYGMVLVRVLLGEQTP